MFNPDNNLISVKPYSKHGEPLGDDQRRVEYFTNMPLHPGEDAEKLRLEALRAEFPSNDDDVVDDVVNFLNVGFNLDSDPADEQQHLGTYIPQFVGSEFVGDENANAFISVFNVDKVRHFDRKEIRQQEGNPSGAKKELYTVLGSQRIRSWQFLSDFHPASLTGDEDAILRWRSTMQPLITRERALFEKRRSKLRHDGAERLRRSEDVLAEGIAQHQVRLTQSTLP
jgi:hypothetical protein